MARRRNPGGAGKQVTAKQVQMLTLLQNELAIAQGAWEQRRQHHDPALKRRKVMARKRYHQFWNLIAPEDCRIGSMGRHNPRRANEQDLLGMLEHHRNPMVLSLKGRRVRVHSLGKGIRFHQRAWPSEAAILAHSLKQAKHITKAYGETWTNPGLSKRQARRRERLKWRGLSKADRKRIHREETVEVRDHLRNPRRRRNPSDRYEDPAWRAEAIQMVRDHIAFGRDGGVSRDAVWDNLQDTLQETGRLHWFDVVEHAFSKQWPADRS